MEDHLERIGVAKELYLKVGAPVILITTLQKSLPNGMLGIVEDICDTSVKVKFDGMRNGIEIERYTFTVYDAFKEKNIASCRQIPLKLAFALTVHRAQGMTLPRVVVDCRDMFRARHVGVAVGRAVNSSGLQVLNFNPRSLQRQPQYIQDFLDSPDIPFSAVCCTQETTPTEEVTATTSGPATDTEVAHCQQGAQLQDDITSGPAIDTEEAHCQQGAQLQDYDGNLWSSDFDSSEETAAEFEEVTLPDMTDPTLAATALQEEATLPSDFPLTDFISGLKYPFQVTPMQVQFNTHPLTPSQEGELKGVGLSVP